MTAGLLLALASCAFGQVDQIQLPTNGRIIVSVTVAPWVMKPCSRQRPQGATGYWVPTESEINLLESRLVTFLKSYRSEEVPPNTSYNRQYAGFLRGSRRYIYGNFFPSKGKISRLDRDQYMQMCDNGPEYWGIVYDIETGKFSELAVNPEI